MDLYLNNCLKAAEAAASKAASGNLKTDKDTCSTKRQKPVVPKIGPSSLLDLPLGAKLPIIPGSTNIFYTTNISEKLYRPSFGFNLSDPYCRLMETTYQSLHDPHLKAYFRRKDMLKKLRQGGYITSNNKVICSLKELNKYRQYLTTLKIDFERNYVREQKIIESQVNKLNEERRACDEAAAAASFQQWLLREGKKTSPHQDHIIKRRHLRMINKELDKIEDTLGRRNTLQLEEEDRLHWHNVQTKLNQHKEIEEEWQSKEMTLLSKIGEEVKREAKADEHRRKIREEINQKKQVMLQKRMAYHLQKLQEKDSKEESVKKKREATVPESKRQPETASSITQKRSSLAEENTSPEHLERKSSISSLRTSFSDERLLQESWIAEQRQLAESRESKSTSQATKPSFDEEKSSFYELLETKFSSTGTRRSSLPDEQILHEFMEPKHHRHPSMKKTSFAEQTLFYEPTEQKYGPATTKRSSFINQKFIGDLLEARYLYPNTMRASFTDHRLKEDNLETKSPPNVKKTSFDEDRSFQQLMDAITPPQYIKKTSFADQKSSQESLGSKRSSLYSQSHKFFVKTSASLPPQQRSGPNTTEPKYDRETSRRSHHSLDRGTKRISIPASSHTSQATEVSRQSLHDIPKQEANIPFQNTHKQRK
ncbi:fibrous sheath-interacting protein 2-like isoform X2 [Peromyscus leucopus]|uniref:fibrous sheath-interacting protein 2-like isoform X2 n=1 Tax=Peromyscus leucopus TaxID=10041 RepID=UPI0018850730|nr:fibrous sheath-interacting protein 2-like isoform X2 [Peromyscus leucopus]